MRLSFTRCTGPVRQGRQRAEGGQPVGGEVRDFEPGVLEPGPVAVHQPRHRRGRERPRARARAGLPQLHRHLVLPGKGTLEVPPSTEQLQLHVLYCNYNN